MPPTAVTRTPRSAIGTTVATYRAKTIAIAAMIPECMLQNIAHAQRNPAAGENISRRNTYTPPVRGNADASSAHTLAPNHVSAPAAIHTSSVPATVGTARLTSDGCTKIDAPTIVPTTIAVAWVRPIERDREDIAVAGRWTGCYHR